MVGLAGCGAGFTDGVPDVCGGFCPDGGGLLPNDGVAGNSCMNILMKRKVVRCGECVAGGVLGVVLGLSGGLYYVSNHMVRNMTAEAQKPLTSAKNGLVAQNGVPRTLYTRAGDEQPAAKHEVLLISHDPQPTDLNHDLQRGDDPTNLRGEL